MKEIVPQVVQRSLDANSNFSFTMVDGEIWQQATVNNSLFNGSVFSNCLFQTVCFDHSDLEGTRFINCRFIDCSMVGTETRSVWAANCTFQRVNFSQSSILDSTYHSCTFTECLFDGIVQSNSEYEECLLDPFRPTHGSISLNRYTNTTFRHARFRNVFYYHIFKNCTFEKSYFEAYLLGYVYGLTKDNLSSLHSVLMGEDVSAPLSDLQEEIERIYTQRKMYLNIGILRLGAPSSNIDSLLIGCAGILEHLLREDQILKTEQIQYLSGLIDYLRKQNKVAPVTFLLLEQGLREMIDRFSVLGNTAWEKAKLEIQSFRNRIFFSCLEILDDIYAKPMPQSYGQIAVFKITYDHEPELALTDLIKEMCPALVPTPTQIKTAQGSWLEWISAPDNVITCISLLVSLLGSIAVPIILDKRRERREEKKEKSKESKTVPNVSVHLTLAAPYADAGSSITVKKSIPSVLQVIVSRGILDSPSKKGYGTDNVRAIEILSPVSEHQGME